MDTLEKAEQQMLLLPPDSRSRGTVSRHLRSSSVPHFHSLVCSFSASRSVWQDVEVSHMVTLLQIFIGWVILTNLGQLYLMARYILWPRLRRILCCPWCWQDCGMMAHFPLRWSSSICGYHEEVIRAQQAHRRSLRRQRWAQTQPEADVLILLAGEVQR